MISIYAKSKNFSYPIIIGKDLIKKLPYEINRFTKSKKILILIDTYFYKMYYRKIKQILSYQNFEVIFFKINAGKKCKDIKVLLAVINSLEKNKFSKDSTLVVFGGGTIGDMGGF